MATTYSYSSSTFSTTGILYTTYSNLIWTTVSGPTTTTITQTTSSTLTETTVTVSTTSQFTTVSCGPLPCGFVIGSENMQGMNLRSPVLDNTGLLAMLLLIVPMLLRRLFS
jgi:hypothetical protein